MQMIRLQLAIAVACLLGAGPARGDDASVARSAGEPAGDLDLRLTLSTFLFRETGADAGAIVDQGAALPNASPVRRTFGDLRTELGRRAGARRACSPDHQRALPGRRGERR